MSSRICTRNPEYHSKTAHERQQFLLQHSERYGVPEELREQAMKYLDDMQKKILRGFHIQCKSHEICFEN
jgi:hypothetical protein